MIALIVFYQAAIKLYADIETESVFWKENNFGIRILPAHDSSIS